MDRKALDAGDARAMADVGVMYAKGWGVAKDPVEAVKWYLVALSTAVMAWTKTRVRNPRRTRPRPSPLPSAWPLPWSRMKIPMRVTAGRSTPAAMHENGS